MAGPTSPPPRWPTCEAPTLLIVGGRDIEVLRLNQGAARAMHCQVRLEVVPGATHLFEEPGALETVAHLAGELVRQPPAAEGSGMRGRAFADRTEAGRALARRLLDAALVPPLVVLALPRGGVPVAAEVARALQAPLDLLLVRKIGAPWQPELAVAALVDGDPPDIVVDETTSRMTGVDRDYIDRRPASRCARSSAGAASISPAARRCRWRAPR